MLEVIGLIALAVAGVGLTVVGAIGFFAATVWGSSHKSDYCAPLIAAVIGVAILCSAAYLSPFSIVRDTPQEAKQGEQA